MEPMGPFPFGAESAARNFVEGDLMQTHCAHCNRELYTGHQRWCPYHVEKETTLTQKIPSWIMAAATRILDDLPALQEEAAQVALTEFDAEAGRQYLLGAVAHLVWVASQKEAAR